MKESGFGLLEAGLILVIAGILAFTGWYVINTKNTVDNAYRELANPPSVAVSHGGPARDYISLIDNLRAKGAVVEPVDADISDPAFSVPGRVIKVNGEAVRVFEYASPAAAKRDLGNDTKIIEWAPGTRLYLKEKIISVAVSGSSQELLDLLSSVLGKAELPAGP